MHNVQDFLNNQEVNYKTFDEKTSDRVSTRLRELRKEKFENTETLKRKCELMEVPAGYYSMLNFERTSYSKKRNPTKQNVDGMRLATFYELCLFYDVSPNYLLCENSSRHTESTADMIKSEWKITDDILDIFKFAARHNVTNIDGMNEMEFLEYILKECFLKIEEIAGNYIETLKEIYEFKKKYIDGNTNLIKEEYILNEVEITDDYQDLKERMTLYKIEILKLIEKFLENLYKKFDK